MTAERYQRVVELFHGALELKPEARAAFLAQACTGDAELRQDVEAMLAADAKSAGFLDEPADDLAASAMRPGDHRSLVGRRFLGYEVVSLLGSGGMGEVYRARDSKLKREIALKVLPAAFASDPERMSRFQREAQVLASLNHPNIVTIYDIDACDGMDFIAMEYVSGRTLDQLIPRRGMKTTEVLRCAVQTADALAAAHAAGIIHRDLKPGNIMVGDTGLVKVLDFGLAKLAEKTGAEEATETMRPPSTEEGHILGTVAYMSPEQAQGLKLDARSDIFSFGAVLYEMITSRRAFSGDTNISTLAAILNREPQPLAATTPRELDRIVTRCLRKDPARRFQTMADLKVALEELKEESESGRLEAPHIPAVSQRLWPLVGAVIALAVIVTVGTWWLWSSRGKTVSSQPNLRQLTYDAGDTSFPALSPDAKLVAYQSDRAEPGRYDIWVQQTSGGPAIRLTKGPESYLGPVFSADGSKIYFYSWLSGIYEVSTLGGDMRLIAADGVKPSVSPDGRSIAYLGGPTRGDLYVMPTSGGRPRAVAPGYEPGNVFSPPIWSPDSRRIAFWGEKNGQPQTNDYWVVPADGGNPENVGWRQWAIARGVSDGSVAAWLPGDVLICWLTIGDTTRIYRWRLVRRGLRLRGEPEALTLGTALDTWPTVAAGKVAFQSGGTTVGVVSGGSAFGIWSLPADTNQGRVTGSLEKLTADKAAQWDASLTPDGTTLVYSSKRTIGIDIYLRDMRSGEERALVADREPKAMPLVSADGSKVVYAVQVFQPDSWPVYVVPTGGGPQRKICDDCGFARSLSPDGNRFLASRADPQGRYIITLVNVDSGKSTVLLHHSRYEVLDPRFSPDGKWVAFLMRGDVGSQNVAVAPFRGEADIPEEDWIGIGSAPRTFNYSPFWSPNGELLYYVSSVAGQSYIMAQRLDRGRHPAGAPFRVYQFSGRLRLMPSYTGAGSDRLTAVPGRIVGTIGEFTNNIWLMDLPK